MLNINRILTLKKNMKKKDFGVAFSIVKQISIGV